MAFKSASGLKLLLKFGNGADPEVFNVYCSITAKSVTFDGQENTFNVGDCDNPEAVSWLEAEMASKRVTFEGSGTLNTPDFDLIYERWDEAVEFNAQLVLDVLAADGGRILEGAWLLPKFTLTGNKGEKTTVSISGGSTGPLTKTNNT